MTGSAQAERTIVLAGWCPTQATTTSACADLCDTSPRTRCDGDRAPRLQSHTTKENPPSERHVRFLVPPCLGFFVFHDALLHSTVKKGKRRTSQTWGKDPAFTTAAAPSCSCCSASPLHVPDILCIEHKRRAHRQRTIQIVIPKRLEKSMAPSASLHRHGMRTIRVA